MARAKTRTAKGTRSPRPRRDGALPTSFELSRDHRLASITTGGQHVFEPAARTTLVVELAWDGHRVLACASPGPGGPGPEDVRLVSSDHREWGSLFPTIGMALRRLRATSVVVEGWICALGDSGLPSFERLRLHARKEPQRIVFMAWDLLHLNGEDLRSEPLAVRRARLEALLFGQDGSVLTVSEALSGGVEALLIGARSIGARGIVVRDGAAPYPRVASVATDGAAESPWLIVPCSSDAIAIDRTLSPPPVVTNPDKVMFPRDAITKRDVVAYYEDVSPLLLRYMRDRPIVGQRWPDGIDEFTWYQHRMPPRAPDYLRAVWIEGNRRIVIENSDALLWLANQAVLTFHGWSSRVASLPHPDWVVLDLDPGANTTWEQTVEVAIAVRKLFELLELPSVPKTSGQKGLHVLVPIAAGQSVAQGHELARRVAKMLSRLLPHLVTLESSIEARGGRLYLDHLQNFVGKTLVLPYSLRAVDGAPVSTPLAWSEVTPRLRPRELTLRTLRTRLDTHGDLAAPLLEGTTRLEDVLDRIDP